MPELHFAEWGTDRSLFLFSLSFIYFIPVLYTFEVSLGNPGSRNEREKNASIGEKF